MHHLLVLDTETAGFDGGVCDIAWIDIDDNYTVLSEVQSFINPERPISAGASGVHGLVDDDVKDCPTLSTFMESLGNPFQGKSVLMIGHNISFDIRMVGDQLFGNVTPLCTLRLSRRIFTEAPDHRLQTLMYYLKLNVKGKHNALDDVYTSYELLQKCGEETGLSLEGLFDLNQKPLPIKKITFGKHKGELLTDLPAQYVSWLLGPKGPDKLDPDLRIALEAL